MSVDIFNLRRSIALNELSQCHDEDIREFLEVSCDHLYWVEDTTCKLLYVNTDNGNVVPVYGEYSKEQIHYKNKCIDEMIEEGNYEGVIMLADGQHAMLVLDILINQIPLNKRYKCFMLAYGRCDFNFEKSAINIDYYEILMDNSLSDEQIERLEPDTFNGEITVYRAQGSRSCPIDQAISWTTSLSVAEKFAKVHNTAADGVIYKAEVNIEDIADYITHRNEEEIIVNYNHLKNVRLLGGN